MHRCGDVLLNDTTHALDDADFALGFRDFEFRYVRLGHEIDEGFEFSQIHGSSNGYKTDRTHANRDATAASRWASRLPEPCFAQVMTE
ncbi:hypothetical protein D3C72_1764370 [compost metagenome]